MGKIEGFLYAKNQRENLDKDYYDKLEEYYNNHYHIVKTFAFFNPISSYGIEYEDYVQMLSIKLWELVKKFDWDRYSDKDYSEECKAFYSYAKKSFRNYVCEIIKESFDPINKTESLDKNISNNEDFSLLDIISDEKINMDEQYLLTKLHELKTTSIIKGFLLDKIEGMNYNQISKKYKCSRGKVKRQLEKELEILKKIV